MPIFRLSAQEIRGFVIDDDPKRAIEIARAGHEAFAALLIRAITDYNLQMVVCPPGRTNITPTYWRRNRVESILEVLPDAESALCHAVPRDHNFEPAQYTPVADEIVAQDLRTTHSIKIPEDTPVLPIIGAVAEDRRLRVHEIIAHL